MKALSLWQPWATLIAIGAKKFETRSWSTNYRGPLLIHAAKNDSELDLFYTKPFHDDLSRAGYQVAAELPRGAIVAICNLGDVKPTHVVRASLADNERAYGDYSDSRFAWQLDDVKAALFLDVRGAQGLFDLDWTPQAERALLAKLSPRLKQMELFE